MSAFTIRCPHQALKHIHSTLSPYPFAFSTSLHTENCIRSLDRNKTNRHWSAKQTKKNPRQWEGLEGASKARCTAPKSFHPSKPIVIGTWETRGQTDRKPVAPVENCCIYTLEAIKSSVYRPTEGCCCLLSLLYLFRQGTGRELDGSETRRKYLQTGPSTTA